MLHKKNMNKIKLILFSFASIFALNANSQDFEFLERYKKDVGFDIVMCSNFKEKNKLSRYIVLDIRDSDDVKRYGKIKNSFNVPAFYNNGTINGEFINQINKYLKLKQNILLVSHDGQQSLITAQYMVANEIYPREKISVLYGGYRKWSFDKCKEDLQ